MSDSFKKASKQFEQSKRLDYPYIPGVLGFMVNGQETVENVNRPGYVYVRLRGVAHEVIQAFNDLVTPIYNLPVLVIRDDVDSTRYRVFARDTGAYVNWGTASSYLPKHGDSHSFADRYGTGGDISWIYGKQLMPLNVTPSGSSSSGGVMIEPGIYYQSNQWHSAGGTGTVSLLPAKPSAGNARMMLVYLDEHGNPGLATGTTFSATISGSSALVPYLPTITNSYYVPLAGVRLTSSTTSIVWGDITDLRPWIVGDGFIPTGTFAPNTASFITVGNEASLTSERRLVGTNGIAVTDNGANSTVELSFTGSMGGSGGGGDLLIYDDGVFQVTGTALNFGDGLTVSVSGSVALIASAIASTGSAIAWNSVTFIPEGSSTAIEYPKTSAGLAQAIANHTTDWGLIKIPNGIYTLNTGTSSSNLSYAGQSMDSTIININIGGSQEYGFNTGANEISFENLQFNIVSTVDFVSNPTPTVHYGVYVKGAARNILVNMDHQRANNATGSGHSVEAFHLVAQPYDTGYYKEPYVSARNITAYLNGSCASGQVAYYTAVVIEPTSSTYSISADTIHGYTDASQTHAYGINFSGSGDLNSMIDGQLRKVSKISNSSGLAISYGGGAGNKHSIGFYLNGMIEANNCYAYAKGDYSDLYYAWGGYLYTCIGFDSNSNTDNILRFYNCNVEIELSQDADPDNGVTPTVYGYRAFIENYLATYKPYSTMKDCRAILKCNANSMTCALKAIWAEYSSLGIPKLLAYNCTLNAEDETGAIGVPPVLASVGGNAEIDLYDCVINNTLYGTYSVVNNNIYNVQDGVMIYDDNTFITTGTSLHFNDNLNVVSTGSSVWVDSKGLTIYDDATIKATGTTTLVFGSGISVAITGSFVFISVP